MITGNGSKIHDTCKIVAYCLCNEKNEEYYEGRKIIKLVNYNENFARRRYFTREKKMCVVAKNRPRARSNA